MGLKKILFYFFISAVFCDFFLSYVDIVYYPPKNYIVVICFFLITFMIFLNEIAISVINKLKLTKYVALIIFFSFINLVISGISPINTILKILSEIVPGFIMAITAFICIKNYGIRKCSTPFIIFGTFTSLVALFQFLNFNFAWSLRAFLGFSNDLLIEEQIISRIRIPGMAFYSITLSYQLIVVFGLFIVKSIEKYSKNFGYNVKSFSYESLTSTSNKLFISFSILFGIFISGVRSATFGILLLIKYIPINRIIMIIFFVMISVLLIVINFDGIKMIKDRFLFFDATVYSRIPQLIVGTQVIMSNPFGIGERDYYQITDKYLSSVFGIYKGYKYVGKVAPHNSWINAGLYFGWAALLLFIGYHFYLFKNFYRIRKYDLCVYVLAFTLIAYILNSLVHNAGPLLGEPMGWYLFAFSEVIIKKYSDHFCPSCLIESL